VRASNIVLTSEEEALSVSYKQPASINLSYSVKQALTLLIYKGTSLRELRDFLLSCKVYFNAVKKYIIHR
jgi:hypothetical protein